MKRRFYMKRSLAFLLVVSLLLCCGCSSEPEPPQTEQPTVEATIPCTEAVSTEHTHIFGEWEYGQAQMQRVCQSCGELELRDMTDEEQFWQLLKGHWEPYEVTFMGKTQLVFYIRSNVWYVYADYTAGDTLTYTSALSEKTIADFTRDLTVEYSHFDTQTSTHHAVGTSADGLCYQIALKAGNEEPLLRLTPELGADMFDEIVFSRYAQVAPVAAGTWSGIVDGKVLFITLNEDLTFTSNIETYPSGTWQLAPVDALDIGTVQLFYKDQNGRSLFDLGHFRDEIYYNPDVEEELLDLELVLYPPYGNDMWYFRKLQPEMLQPLLDQSKTPIIGTWDSKRKVSLMRDGTTEIWTGHTLTVKEDGTFTLTADIPVSGTWAPNGTTLVDGNKRYKYLFSYPGCGKNGDDVTISPESGNLHFSCKQGKTYIHLYFAQYDEAQWADFLAGPDLLPGSYISKKLIRYDEAGQAAEEVQTGYNLTIKEDGTVTGMLHKNVSGTWTYDDLATEGGHRYIFRMDHTPPEQSSVRKGDGTLVFDTKIDGEHVVIYFYPE